MVNARLLVLPSGHGDDLAEVSSAPADEDDAEIAARLLDRVLASRSRTAEAAAGEARAVILFWRKSPVVSNGCRNRGAEARCRRGHRRARACPGCDARHGQSRPDDSHPGAPHRGLEGRDVTEARRGWSVPLVSATR